MMKEIQNNMTKQAIYYTDNRLDPKIMQVCQNTLLKSFKGDIVSVSLKPINFGFNCVVDEPRGYPTMIKQIYIALKNSIADYVFFTEHDVLYSREHFDFTPPKDDIFYYNRNVWRWEYGSKIAVRYDRMLPLSCLCVNREFALNHYKLRLATITERLGEFQSKEPSLARKWGYEPGTKKKKRGGITDDDFETWESEVPVIDIRHRGTFSPPKCTLSSFKHQPKNWQEIPIEEIPYWNLKELFI